MDTKQMDEWKEAQKWEKEWHGDCVNSFHEERKQFVYANRMGLDEFKYDDFGRINYNFGDRTVIDIGGGPYSLLLKSSAKFRTVVDPCQYPDWVLARYKETGIYFCKVPAETINIFDLKVKQYDIALIYNCLQHVIDPEKIIANVRKIAKEIRIFEWIDHGVSAGHLHNLKEDKLNLWLHGRGKVEQVNEIGCRGKAYYGIFPVNYTL